jgi:predicted nicotinamide N-methyase
MSRRRALVARHTRLQDVAGLDGIRLHLADDLDSTWHATEDAIGGDAAPIPFWAFAWAGGLALARYLATHADEVRDRQVLDFATGSGVVAIAAARAGAARVVGADIDPFAEAAFERNVRANRVRATFIRRDLLDEPPPEDVDVLLAADTWYEGPLAERVLPWLQAAATAGTRVLVADPGRKYLPPAATAGLVPLAMFEVHTTTTLEDRATVSATVYALAVPPGR